ncbi:NLR family CARD domain-containing protein 3 [Trichomycterus rosablanca]|uniref:NLR family CARD domain-containing protein 3 n=1 Tax=Trichomycterus rosablanca TaxID=2290929 RepID=UPI002F354581
MAFETCCAEINAHRVELVEKWSKHLNPILDLLFQVGAVTEEDLSYIKGGGHLGERHCMRTLLDVLNGRGEEACRAFLYILPNVLNTTGSTKLILQNPSREHLQQHKDIIARQHAFLNYIGNAGRTSGFAQGTRFTDITFLRQIGCKLPLKFQHESSIVGEPFRAGRVETRGQGETCSFKDVYQSMVSVSMNGVVLLSGVAGSGKTTVVKRLVQEWALDETAQKIILSLSFRELNLITEAQSLQSLVSDHYSHLKPILPELLTSNQEQVLLILDGLDEFCHPLDFGRTPKCSDPERELMVDALVVNLIKRNLLPGIAVFLTSRPHAVAKVPHLLVNQFYSVSGFSPSQQQQYFEQSCSSKQAADVVWSFVSSHRPLQLMCHIPAFCWIVSTALQNDTSHLFFKTASLDAESQKSPNGFTEEVKADQQISTRNNAVITNRSAVCSKPVTITEIYCCFLKSLVLFHVGGCVEGMHLNRLQDAPRVLKETKAHLRCLGALAFKGLLERRFVFDSSDLASFSLDCNELVRAFLVEIFKEDRASLTYEKNFHFIHTSVQEFLAALYYVLESFLGLDPFLQLNPSVGLLPPAVLKHLRFVASKLQGRKRMLRRHIKKAFHWGEQQQSGHLDLFCRFVSGLLVPKTRVILNSLFHDEPRSHLALCMPLPAVTASFLLQLLRSQLKSSSLSPERQLNVCHCLYEAQDPGLPQRLQAWLKILSLKDSDQCVLANKDWNELAFLLQLSPDLQELKLDAQGLDAQGLRRLLPVLPLFSTLSLALNPLGPEGAEVLSHALRSPDCQIKKLWVVSTGLGCEGVRILSEGLKDNHTVFDLRMAINQIGDSGAACLAELLKTNCTLKDIRLRDNFVTDRGAELLMAALMENTTLEFLWLFDNKLSKQCVQQLKDFSKRRPNLDIKVCY